MRFIFRTIAAATISFVVREFLKTDQEKNKVSKSR